ncbi:hypothetical protein [Methanoculleus chikugoensis]|nr:hypothetical protein [Methanoculleus chikugoensis]
MPVLLVGPDGHADVPGGSPNDRQSRTRRPRERSRPTSTSASIGTSIRI